MIILNLYDCHYWGLVDVIRNIPHPLFAHPSPNSKIFKKIAAFHKRGDYPNSLSLDI